VTPCLSRVPSRSARRSSAAARRAWTGSTASDFTESCAARSRRPIISASSLIKAGWRSVTAVMISAGIFRITAASVAWAAAGYGRVSITATPPKTSPGPSSSSTTSLPARECRRIFTWPDLTTQNQRAGSPSMKTNWRGAQASSTATAPSASTSRAGSTAKTALLLRTAAASFADIGGSIAHGQDHGRRRPS